MLQLFAFAIVIVLFTNQTQAGPIGDFPIKTFPRVLSDVRRIFSEASEEIARTRSSLQAMIASLTNAASDPSDEGAIGLRCQSYQLAFEGSVTLCIDVDFQGDFDDTTRVMLGDSVVPSNRAGCEEGCEEVDKEQDGAVSPLDAEELPSERGSGQREDVEVGTERDQKFEQLIENGTLATDIKTSIRREEISEIQKGENSSTIDDEIHKNSKEPDMKIADEQDVANLNERLASFFENLTNKFKNLSNLLAKTNSKELTRNKRASILKVPVPRISITLSF